jgi:hypothetical protein
MAAQSFTKEKEVVEHECREIVVYLEVVWR